jgi:hypothetical protein
VDRRQVKLSVVRSNGNREVGWYGMVNTLPWKPIMMSNARTVKWALGSPVWASN